MPITQRQQKYLLDRLQEIRNTKPRHYDDVKLPVPVAVRVAMRETVRYEKIIARFNSRQFAAKKKRNAVVSKYYDDCRVAILFGDTKKALKALARLRKRVSNFRSANSVLRRVTK